MKTLTIRAPWSGLVAAGIKDCENRSWQTKYRGPIAIHSAMSVAPPAEWEHARLILRQSGNAPSLVDVVPIGVMLGTVDLVDISLGGDFSHWAFPGMFHWKLENPQPFPEPIPCPGKQGLWNWEPS